jgi:omega-6 fatty acid desaturase (delta-12 desaturase)
VDACPHLPSNESTFLVSGNMSSLQSRLKPFAEEDRTRTWVLTLVTIVLFGISIRGTFADLSWAIRIPSSLLCGLISVRCFILYHDYSHGALFRDSRVGGMLMSLLGTLLLRPPADWRRSHNFHHAHNTQFATANVGSFPIKTTHEYLALNSQQRRKYRIIRSPLVILFGYFTCFVLESFKKVGFREEGLTNQAIASLVIHFLLAGISLYFGWDVFLLSFFLPFMISCAVGTYLFYMQHNFEGARFLPDSEWDFEFAALRSSSCLKAGPLTHWFTGNIAYHHIHHLNHRVPFYRLPEAMQAIPELQNPVFVDLKPSTIWRTLNLKLWDPELQRLVSFREFEVNVRESAFQLAADAQ